MNIIITALFGLESLVRDDLMSAGYAKENISVTDGVVTLKVSDKDYALDVARVNMWIRRGERVFIEVGSFKAETFEVFFDGTKNINWNDFIPSDYAFIVNGFSRKSKLFGIPACQSLAKKAIVDSLRISRHLSADSNVYEDSEVGIVRIQFGIVEDIVKMMIDTSGDGLHKRGYRPLTHEAPIKETLASAFISLAHYKPFGYEALVDPLCGSGTILIEAAMMALNIAPGKNRHFAYENLPYIGFEVYEKARNEALELEDLSELDDCYYWGSDIDKTAIDNARKNARNAGVDKFIKFEVADFKTQTPQKLLEKTHFDRQLIITNPPYGGRLLTEAEAFKIYKSIAYTYLDKYGHCKKGIRLSVVTPDDTFERETGYKADKRTKVYNGNIKCQFNNYYKMSKKPD